MKKHTYRAQKVNTINWQQVKEQTAGETLVLAVDVAKVQQYALLSNQEHTNLVDAMESSGTYVLSH